MTKKTSVGWLVGIVVVVAGMLIWSNNSVNNPDSNGVNNKIANQNQNTPAPQSAAKKSTPKAPAVSQTYQQALNEYTAIGRRIQFNDNCQANPSNMGIKIGTKIMFDNRSKDTKTITASGLQFTLPPLGWRIETMTTTNKLPYVLNYSCKSSTGAQGSGAMQLQANISNF